MTINNLEIIKSLLKWEDQNDFYFVQILIRRKDNPNNKSNSSVIKSYYISSMESLEKLFPEMILLAKLYNARVYINLNRRNYEKLAFQMLKKITDCIINKDFKNVKRSYDAVCGAYSNERETKKWIVDIDGVNLQQEELIHAKITESGGVVYIKMPTVNGIHFITSTFNTYNFAKEMGDLKEHVLFDALEMPEIKKNNPSLLYYSDEPYK